MPYHGDVRGIAIGDAKMHPRTVNLRAAVPDLTWNQDRRNRKSYAEGCVDETSGSETGMGLSGTNARLDLTVQ